MDAEIKLAVLKLIEEPPAIVSVKYLSVEHRKLDLTGLKTFLRGTHLPFKDFLSKERHILSQLLYNMNSAFKKHKFYQFSKRLLKLLVKINDIQIVRQINDLCSSVELDRDDSCRFYSLESFDFVLANVFSLIKILQSVPEKCIECYKSLGIFMDMGHFTMQCCLFVGVVAFVRNECLISLKKFIEVYNKMILFSSLLKPGSERSCYVRLNWPKEEGTGDLEMDETLKKNEKTMQHMAFFENLLKTYNQNMDFKTGLNRALLDKFQLARKTKMDDEKQQLGTVVTRFSDLEILQKQLENVKTVKSLKIFYKTLRILSKSCPKENRPRFLKAVRLLRAKYPNILLKKKLKDKVALKSLITKLKNKLNRVLLL